MKIPQFETKKELFAWLIANKDLLISSKKAAIKKADGISFFNIKENITNKSVSKKADTENELYRKLVINTTNYMDSHSDVHIPGLWTKSLQENKNILFLQEHEMEFDKLIAKGKDLKAYTENFNWIDLGYNKAGVTEALCFEAIIRKDINEDMFDKYLKNYVDNHSVGMRYIKMVFCVNDIDYGAENEAWNKYFPMLINQERATEQGYFWAVTEAKIIEGSAVLLGSNPITPTLNNKELNNIENISKTLNTLLAKIEEIKPFNTLNEIENKKPETNNEKLNKLYLLINKL
jgi:hypothetical protein